MQRITEDHGEHGSHIHGMSASMAELTRRTAMLSAVAYMATRIVAEPAWRDLMPDLLERLGQATKMSRVIALRGPPRRSRTSRPKLSL